MSFDFDIFEKRKGCRWGRRTTGKTKGQCKPKPKRAQKHYGKGRYGKCKFGVNKITKNCLKHPRR